MKCPNCGTLTRITGCRETERGCIKRRRECPECRKQFTTVESRYAPRKKNPQTAIEKFLAIALRPRGGQ